MRFNSVLISSLFFASCAVSDEATNNWAGVQLNENAGTFVFVSGDLVVPHVWGKGGSAVAATVTLDDDGHCDNYLQAGILAIVADRGTQYRAFYKWSPDDRVFLSDIMALSALDAVHISIDGSSDLTSPTVTVHDLKNNKVFSQSVSTGHQLCGQSVAWTAEDPTLNGGPAVLGNFTTMRFTRAKASDGSGQSYAPQGGDILQMTDSNEVGLTYAVANGDSVIITLYKPE